jgi:hypothetical protein
MDQNQREETFPPDREHGSVSTVSEYTVTQSVSTLNECQADAVNCGNFLSKEGIIPQVEIRNQNKLKYEK